MSSIKACEVMSTNVYWWIWFHNVNWDQWRRFACWASAHEAALGCRWTPWSILSMSIGADGLPSCITVVFPCCVYVQVHSLIVLHVCSMYWLSGVFLLQWDWLSFWQTVSQQNLVVCWDRKVTRAQAQNFGSPSAHWLLRTGRGVIWGKPPICQQNWRQGDHGARAPTVHVSFGSVWAELLARSMGWCLCKCDFWSPKEGASNRIGEILPQQDHFLWMIGQWQVCLARSDNFADSTFRWDLNPWALWNGVVQTPTRPLRTFVFLTAPFFFFSERNRKLFGKPILYVWNV